MALGRQGERQGDLVVTWTEMPRSPGHVFYDRLQGVLIDAGCDVFAETACQPYYAAKMGAPSIPPGRYFRMHMVGYFEGIDSERGIEWRCAKSLSLREFLRLGTTERVPDHSWLSKTRSRLPHEVHTTTSSCSSCRRTSLCRRRARSGNTTSSTPTSTVTGAVCLGVLQDSYSPGLDFGLVCQMLVDMAGYRNYELTEGYDPDAGRWAPPRRARR